MPKKAKIKLTSKEWLICICGLLIYFLFIHTLDKTLNYPLDEILYYPSIAISLVIFITKLKKLLVEAGEFKTLLEKVMFVGLRYITIMLLSLYAVSIILIPFNYYNINYSKRNTTERYYCEITNYTKGHYLYYKFENRTNIIHAYVQLTDEAYSAEKYDRYLFVATVKKGLLGTSILKTWELKHK